MQQCNYSLCLSIIRGSRRWLIIAGQENKAFAAQSWSVLWWGGILLFFQLHRRNLPSSQKLHREYSFSSLLYVYSQLFLFLKMKHLMFLFLYFLCELEGKEAYGKLRKLCYHNSDQVQFSSCFWKCRKFKIIFYGAGAGLFPLCDSYVSFVVVDNLILVDKI